ncbi:RsmD family RNA methyltransferase [Spiroplasma endosymbiont of Anurida maritima]|uniref:RsmD family RNA methyltransferase n=1 Tax=Spiroplasma endosymbiont of Anurida maritima TaxID=2967972 RepID=UPI0036D2C01B
MKIISGKYKGLVLKTIDSMNTRPMLQRIKVDAFNILNNYFIYENKVAVDIFSGSGQLGLESLSRGIKFCYLNDKSLDVTNIIKTNTRIIDESSYQITNFDYLDLLSFFKNNNIGIDLLLLDPPFKNIDFYYNTLDYVLSSDILNQYGIVMCESEIELDFTKYYNKGLKLLQLKKYKNKTLYLLRREE